jgi:hypothetical protein
VDWHERITADGPAPTLAAMRELVRAAAGP